MNPIFCKEKFRADTPIGFIRRFFRAIKYSYQRIQWGFSEEDALYDIGPHLISIIPDMIEYYIEHKSFSPTCFDEEFTSSTINMVSGSETADKRWNDILNHLVFLFREADPNYLKSNTPQRKNKFEEEFLKAWDSFYENQNLIVGNQVNSMRNDPKYSELYKKYHKENDRIALYRYHQLNRAFKLLRKWFWQIGE